MSTIIFCLICDDCSVDLMFIFLDEHLKMLARQYRDDGKESVRLIFHSYPLCIVPPILRILDIYMCSSFSPRNVQKFSLFLFLSPYCLLLYYFTNFHSPLSHLFQALDLIGASITAKYAASLATYPHEVLRSRIQDSQHKSLTLKKAFLDIVQREGFWALWVGIRVNLLKVIPSTVSTFLAYEYFSRYFAGVFASSTR